MVDYTMDEWDRTKRWPPMVCHDTTGPFVVWREPFYFAGAIAALSAAALRGRIALLHLHMAERGSVLRKAVLIQFGRLIRRPVVVHVHAAEFVEFYESLPVRVQRLITAQLRKADRVLVLGTAWRDYYIGRVRLDPARVIVQHNAVPSPGGGPHPSPRGEPHPTPGGDCRLLFAAALIPRKGLGELIPALGQVRHLRWQLQVAGNGDSALWHRLAETHGIAHRVRFLGWRDSAEMDRLLHDCDVLVLPSHNEGLPMVILEAMAHARPVIATRVGSVADAVDDGGTGLLVPAGNVDALAGALARMIEDPELRARLAAAAGARHAERFAMESANSRLESIFATVIHDAREARCRISA